ncbi:MAG: carbohydrate ABC transporter permease [Clostridiales bacterium]|nr:carbohydrate ABC transporter permease [Clostridiales bacterium]
MYGVLMFTVVASTFPILWVILSSFKTNSQILSSPFSLPTGIDFTPYKSVFLQYNFLLFGTNSLIISSLSTVISLLFYAMGAYVIAKYKFPGRNIFYALFTITLLVPAHAKAQPIFSLIMNLNIYDTKTALVLVYLSSGMAMSMFVLRATFRAIPDELTESAVIEGASFLRVFLNINLPLAKSGLATAGTLMFLGNWNEFFYASILTSSPSNRTLPYALQFFNESFSYDYPRMFAALTMVILPGIIIYIFAQEQVQRSFASSGIKG